MGLVLDALDIGTVLSQVTVDLVRFRRELHRRPELGGEEEGTAAAVRARLDRLSPDSLHLGLGGHGLAARFDGPAPGPSVLVRCELDALPIPERLPVAHASERADASHKCGHDGHMAILVGLATLLAARRPARGRVVLLFQPAEETGEGARRVLEDPAFAPLAPDLAFALHNLPGFPLGQVVVRRGVFASASRGLVARLEGATSHAGHPDQGRSPALAMAHLVEDLSALAGLTTALHEAALVTVVGAMLGGRAFGTSPGRAEVLATLRAHDDAVLERLWKRAAALVDRHASVHALSHEVTATEDFPATVNAPGPVVAVEAAAARLGLPLAPVAGPFPWSEDFGHFTARFPGALFGLGSGTEHPALHSPEYDFPDELVETGAALLRLVVDEALERPFPAPARGSTRAEDSP